VRSAIKLEWGHTTANYDSEIYSGGVVNVIVGPEDDEKTFQMHKALAMQQSGFFRGTFGSDSFKEGATGEVTLRDVQHETFALVLVWLYEGALSRAEEWPEVYQLPDESQFGLLTELSIFSDRYIVQALHTHIIDLTLDYADEGDQPVPNYDTVERAFDNLPETSPYLRLLVDVHCRNWIQSPNVKDEQAAFAQLPATFLYKLVVRYAERAFEETSKMELYKSDYISAAATEYHHDGEPPAKKQKTSH
jgi:hypothetical protein